MLREWKGLGYNSRAVRLHRLARAVVATARRPRAVGNRGAARAAWDRSVHRRRDSGLRIQSRRRAARYQRAAHRAPRSSSASNTRAARRRASSTAARARSLPPGRAHDWNSAMMDLGADDLHGARAEVPALSRCAPIARRRPSTPRRSSASRRCCAAALRRRTRSVRAHGTLRARSNRRPSTRSAARRTDLAPGSASRRRRRDLGRQRGGRARFRRRARARRARDARRRPTWRCANSAACRAYRFPRRRSRARLPLEQLATLERTYPHAVTALEYGNEFQLLVAVILSAQCTDARVNMTTPALFAKVSYAGETRAGAPDRRREESSSRADFSA